MSATGPITPRRARPDLQAPVNVLAAKHPHRWGRVILVVIIILVALMVSLVFGTYWLLHRAQASSSRTVIVHVGAGDSVATLADRLQHRHLISNSLLFRLDARFRNLGNKLKFGDYRLRKNMSIDQMVGALAATPSATLRITIPEGLRMEEAAAIVDGRGIRGSHFLQEAKHPTLQLPLLQDKPPNADLEGYLFPNTYDVPLHYSGKQLADLMVRTLDQKLTPALRAAAVQQGRTTYQVLTLASIIERETSVASERPLVASVYINRLHADMPLDADPTVQYSLGKKGDWWPVLRQDELHVSSPYNTYVNKGLPPGPIDDPGLASITAALNPAKTSYLYFVAKGNGHHAFARTLAEQQANEAKYRKR